MPQESGHIYRSEQPLVGGVCGAFAERFDMDATLIRVLVVVLTVASLGFFAFLYLAMWLILPSRPKTDAVVDVDPDSFKSEVYEQVVRGPKAAPRQVSAAAASMPPQPPTAASAYYAATVSYAQVSMPPAAAAGGLSQAGSSASGGRVPVAIGIAVGVAMLLLGLSALLSNLYPALSVLQFWPVLLIAAGVVRIALPAKDGSRNVTVWLGALLAFVGVVALASSLGVFDLEFDVWLWRAGPFGLVSVGLFIIGRAAKSDPIIVLAAIAFLAFMAFGAYFSLQDDIVELGASLSFGPETFADLLGGSR